MTYSILVGLDKRSGENGDNTVMVVAEKTMNQSINILNSFAGEEADELWNKLVGDAKVGEKV